MSKFRWGPINLAEWKSTPCVCGRAATEEDVEAGGAVFCNKAIKRMNWQRIPNLPVCGIYRQGGKLNVPVVIIQQELTTDGRASLGFRYFNGGSSMCDFYGGRGPEASKMEVIGEPNEEFLELVRRLPPTYDAAQREVPPRPGPYLRRVAGDHPFEVREHIPSGRLAHLLSEFDRAGGAPNYVVMDISGVPVLSREVHAEAATLSLEVEQRRQAESSYALAVEHWRPMSDFFTMSIDLSKLEGQGISTTEFLGSGYDHACQTLVDSSVVPSPTDGYAFAFSQPAHTLGIPRGEQNAFFHELNGELFGGTLHPALEVFAWSTDCSNLFDAGKEWWGALFWTVYNPHMRRVIAILASETD